MTESYEQFINDTTDLTNRGMTDVLSKTYTKELWPLMVGEQLLKKDETLVGTPGLTARFPMRTTRPMPDVYDEIADVPPTGWPAIPQANPAVTYDYVSVTPEKFGQMEIVTSDMIKAANFNVVADKQEALLKGMALFRDMRIWNVILDVQEVTDEAIAGGATEFELDFGGILEITDAPLGTANSYTVDYYRGYIEYDVDPGATTVSYVYTTRTIVEAVTTGALGYEDVVVANASIKGVYGKADTIVVDELGESYLIRDDNIIQNEVITDKGGVILNGQIGVLAGDNVLVSQVMYPSVAVVLQRLEIGYHVFSRRLEAWVEKVPLSDGDQFVATMEKSKPVIVRPELIVVVLNGQSDAYVHT